MLRTFLVLRENRAKIKGQFFRIRRAVLFLFLAGIVLKSTSVHADEPARSWLGSWFNQRTLTGDWGGFRNKLVNKGVDLSANYTTDIAGNPSGGNRKGVNYAGFLQASVALDFEKLASLKGWALTNTHYLASGRNLSNEIGNFFGVQEIYTAGDYYFGQLDLSYTFPGDKLVLEGGRIFAGDVFATSDLWQYYMGAINGNLVSMSGNSFFPHFRTAAWGLRAAYEPTAHWKFYAAAYNANPEVADPKRHGLLLNFETDDGCLGAAQVTYKHNQGHGEGLPGSASLGGYYNSGSFAGVAEPARTWDGNYGMYFIIDQMIFRGEWPQFMGPPHLSSQARYAEKVKQPYYYQSAHPADRPVGLTTWFPLTRRRRKR